MAVVVREIAYSLAPAERHPAALHEKEVALLHSPQLNFYMGQFWY